MVQSTTRQPAAGQRDRMIFEIVYIDIVFWMLLQDQQP